MQKQAHIQNTSNRKRVYYINIAILWLVLLLTPLSASPVSQQIDTILTDPAFAHGIQGVMVKSLKSGEVLYERNADTLLMPASNLKLLTSAVALDTLGKDYTYQTQLQYRGTIDAHGILKGDLILTGDGDPVLKTADLEDFAGRLKSKGIKKIQGNIVVDGSRFDDQRLGCGWSWDDIPYYYAAPVCGLNLNENVVNVYVYPASKIGDKPIVRMIPSLSCIKVLNDAVTGPAGSNKSLWVYRKLGINLITIGGSIPINSKSSSKEEAITVEDPAMYAGNVLLTTLGGRNIKVTGQILSGKADKQSELIAVHRSPILADVLKLLNKPSDNLIAETLLKTVGSHYSTYSVTSAGIQAEMEFAKKIGMDISELKLVDGSGLSRMNYISAKNMVILLAYMYNHKDSKIYIDSLPIAGVDGSLRNRMKSTPAERNVKAKTGYISNVSSLSGYITTKSGEPLAFSILMNNHLCDNSQAKSIQDKICELIAVLP